MGMRTKLNLDGSNRRVAERLGMPGLPSGMPMEWLDAGSWRLPSGKALAEFALQAGFLAPLLFKPQRFGSGTSAHKSAGSLKDRALRLSNKHLGKGSGE